MKFITQVAGIYTTNATTLHVLTGNTPGASKHIQVVDQRDANWEKLETVANLVVNSFWIARHQ